jgi:hypothetical protein
VTSADERRGDTGVNVGAGMFEGISWNGANSEGGTTSVGGDAGGSDACGLLAAVCVESRRHVAAGLLQRSRINLVAARDLLGWGLGYKENGRPWADLAPAGS